MTTIQTVCAWCNRSKNAMGIYEDIVPTETVAVSHGICPDCKKTELKKYISKPFNGNVESLTKTEIDRGCPIVGLVMVTTLAIACVVVAAIAISHC
jgi:hypothetical protein